MSTTPENERFSKINEHQDQLLNWLKQHTNIPIHVRNVILNTRNIATGKEAYLITKYYQHIEDDPHLKQEYSGVLELLEHIVKAMEGLPQQGEIVLHTTTLPAEKGYMDRLIGWLPLFALRRARS